MSDFNLKFTQWWHDFTHRIRNKGNDTWSIDSNDTELIILKNDRKIINVQFNTVVKITAYKKDLITYDPVCIVYTQQNGEVTEICEGMEGFDKVIKNNLRPFTPMVSDWFTNVNNGAFTTNAVVLRQCSD